MGYCNLHTHSSFCDGRDSLEQLLQSALDKGFETIGFSGHGYTPFDLEYSMSPRATEDYRREVSRLQALYGQRIQIYCGLERDFYTQDPGSYDYCIGSVHYLRSPEGYRPVDASPEKLLQLRDECYGGDIYRCCEDYFATVARVQGQTGCDIVGHFDLIKKFNLGGRFFDEEHPRYRAAACEALDALLATEALFELNTSGCLPGRCGQMYPADGLLRRILAGGGRVILSSDCHRRELLDFGFAEARQKLAALGFRELWVLRDGRFQPRPLEA